MVSAPPPLDLEIVDSGQVFACYAMWDNLPSRRSTALPVVVYAIYKSLGDVWNKVSFARQDRSAGCVGIVPDALLGSIPASCMSTVDWRDFGRASCA